MYMSRENLGFSQQQSKVVSNTHQCTRDNRKAARQWNPRITGAFDQASSARALAYHSSKVMRKSMLINHDNSVCHQVMIPLNSSRLAPLLKVWYVWNHTAIVWSQIELCKGDGCSHQLVFASLKVKQTENQATLWIGLINTYQPTKLSGVFHHARKSIAA